MKNWALVSEVRNRLLFWWQSIGLIVVALLLVQTVVGKYEQIESQVWTWAAIGLFPGLVLLYASALLRRAPTKLIAPAVRRAIYSLNAGYLLLIFATLLLQRWGIDMQQDTEGLDVYFRRSLVWLLPFNGLTVLTLAILLLRREALFTPDANAIGEVAKRKATQIEASALPLQRQCFEFVASGDLEATFNLLSGHFKKHPSSPMLQDLLVLSGEFQNLRRDTHLNTIEPAHAQRQINRIAIALLNISDNI